MASALAYIIKCISGSSTEDELDRCMNDFGSKVFYALNDHEQNKMQEVFINTAKSIDLVAYRARTFLIILIVTLIISFTIIIFFYGMCICTNCCNLRTRRKKVGSQSVNTTYLIHPN